MANEVTIHVKAKDDASKTIAAVGTKTKSTIGSIRTDFAAMGYLLGKVGGVAVKFFSDSIAEATEAKKVMAQTNAVLKSTGSAANISAKGVEKLATALSNKTGIDDEAIQSGENLLLTFTNIRNEVGKGNDIFNQATQTITDMSVALGQDMKTSAIQVGKALNDPVKGMTALQRVGVTFTEGQKDMVKKLVKSGDILGAQKIILKELRKEFGGSAEAAATWGDKAKVAADNVKEAFGKKMLPALEKVSQWFVEDGADALAGFTDSLDSQKLNDTADSIITIGNAIGTVTKYLGKWDKLNGRGFTTFGVNLAPMSEAFVTWKVIVLEALASVAEAWAKSPLAPKGAKDAAAALRTMAEAAKKEFNEIQAKAKETADKVANQKVKAKVEANISDLEAKIRTAKKRLKETHNTKTRSKIEADIRQLQARVAAAKAALHGVKNRKVIISAVLSKGFDYAVARARQIAGRGIPARATGGITSAATGGERGNQVLVGEEGPEIVDLPVGSHVNSNADSRRMASSGGSGGPHLHFHFDRYTGSTTDLVRDLVKAKRAGQLDVLFR